jgi:putative NIF3 family GTP cyclohydrolase 1 type 2
VQAQEIARFIEELAPPKGNEEGVRWGDRQAEVSGVLVCWMPTLDAIERCAAEGLNLLITHEEMHYPYPWHGGGLEQHLSWRVNVRRISRLARADITVYRAHGMLDRFCIHEDFAALLGMPEPSVREGYQWVCDIAPLPLRDLIEQVKQRTGMPAVRVSGDLQQQVGRVGLLWGGVGLSLNASSINALLEHNPDVLIAGECDEYAFRMVSDCGVPMIETGHAVSENPGLEHFARYLGESFPGLRVVFHACRPAWQVC